MYHGIGMAGGDHDVVLSVDGVEPLYIHPEEPVAVGDELNFAFLDGGGVHMFVLAQGPQVLGGLVLVEQSFGLLPDVQVLLAHGEEYRDVLLRDYMALAEAGVLGDAPDNLRQVVAEHMPYRVPGVNESHDDGCLLVIKKGERRLPNGAPHKIAGWNAEAFPMEEAPFQDGRPVCFHTGPFRTCGPAAQRHRHGP